MIILPIKSRQQILKERENPENFWVGKNTMLFIVPTPEKNIGPNSKYRATDFVRILPIVTKKIHKKAVIRNLFRRRIKEAFRMIDKSLLKNHYDYQILARHSIFYASVNSIKKDIENCLAGNAEKGIPEKSDMNRSKKKKSKKKRLFTILCQ